MSFLTQKLSLHLVEGRATTWWKVFHLELPYNFVVFCWKILAQKIKSSNLTRRLRQCHLRRMSPLYCRVFTRKSVKPLHTGNLLNKILASLFYQKTANRTVFIVGRLFRSKICYYKTIIQAKKMWYSKYVIQSRTWKSFVQRFNLSLYHDPSNYY